MLSKILLTQRPFRALRTHRKRKREWHRYTAKVQQFRARSSRHDKFHLCVRFQASCFQQHRPSYVSLVARKPFWFWVKVFLCLPAHPGFCGRSILVSYRQKFHVRSSGTASRHRRDSVVVLSTKSPHEFSPICARFFEDVYVVSRTNFHTGLRRK